MFRLKAFESNEYGMSRLISDRDFYILFKSYRLENDIFLEIKGESMYPQLVIYFSYASRKASILLVNGYNMCYLIIANVN
jgi:hypothetical protein